MRSSRLRSAGRSLFLVPVLVLGLGTELGAQEQHGWIGINFDDTVCRLEKLGEDSMSLWVCSIPPMIDTVYQGGPAYVAGIRSGDVIIGVDGFDIKTEEGSRRFSSMRLGVPVTFWLRRGGEELALTVTPASKESAFPEDVREWVESEPGVEPVPDPYDSLSAQMRLFFQNQLRLYHALKEAEVALRAAEERQRAEPTAERRAEVRQLRQQMDSIDMRVRESESVIRLQIDSLAMRAWSGVPEVRAVRPEEQRLKLEETPIVSAFSDAVAGARFEELNEESPLIDYFPGVEAGLLVIEVIAETPAALCGLRAGDVVLEANGEPVDTVAELRRRMRGDVNVAFVRMGRKRFCTIPSR